MFGYVTCYGLFSKNNFSRLKCKFRYACSSSLRVSLWECSTKLWNTSPSCRRWSNSCPTWNSASEWPESEILRSPNHFTIAISVSMQLPIRICHFQFYRHYGEGGGLVSVAMVPSQSSIHTSSHSKESDYMKCRNSWPRETNIQAILSDFEPNFLICIIYAN